MSEPATDSAANGPLRLFVRTAKRIDGRVSVSGTIVSGAVSKGDTVVLSPSNRQTEISAIYLSGAETPAETAGAVDSVTLILDGSFSVEPGETVSHLIDAPFETDVFRSRLRLKSGEDIEEGERLTLKLTGMTCQAWVQELGGPMSADEFEVVLRTRRLIALDPYDCDPTLGQFTLLRDDTPIGQGWISVKGYPDQRDLVTVQATNITPVAHDISEAARARRNGHQPGVLWFTGLSGAGKSTLAIGLERRLFQMGYQTYVLDGDNVRHGLNANLGFSPEDRAENIRRVGEVAALFARAGFLVISAFISPYRSDRERARAAAGRAFHEIHIAADLSVCERRDPKGLYKKARAGEIIDFTGIDAPYEPPAAPDLSVDTGVLTVEEAVHVLVDYVSGRFKLERS